MSNHICKTRWIRTVRYLTCRDSARICWTKMCWNKSWIIKSQSKTISATNLKTNSHLSIITSCMVNFMTKMKNTISQDLPTWWWAWATTQQMKWANHCSLIWIQEPLAVLLVPLIHHLVCNSQGVNIRTKWAPTLTDLCLSLVTKTSINQSERPLSLNNWMFDQHLKYAPNYSGYPPC